MGTAIGHQASDLAAVLLDHARIAVDGVVEEAGMLGVPGRRLFITTTGPNDPAKRRRTGLVICHSFFELKMLQGAEISFLRSAAQQGYCGIYVQARGMGDSEGDPADCTVEARVEAALQAAAHLRDRMPEVERICFTGARFGGAVALLSAARVPGPVALALWDPALDASEYWKHARRFARVVAALGRSKKEDADRQLERDGVAVVVGYTVTKAQRDDLDEIDRIRTLNRMHAPTLVVALNEALLRSARAALHTTTDDLDGVALGLPKPEHLIRLRIAGAHEAAKTTLQWMNRRLD